jgi:hypothetical protein
MVFSQYNVISNSWIFSSTQAVTGSSSGNLLRVELWIQSGTSSYCFTSVSAAAPFISVQWKAAFPISGVIPVC